jgi:hypothetical protein
MRRFAPCVRVATLHRSRLAVSHARSHYEVLGVSNDATQEEIKQAYRKRALECHPDVVPEANRAAASSEFIRLSTAYDALTDPTANVLDAPQPPSHDTRINHQRDFARPRKRAVRGEAEKTFSKAFNGKHVNDVLFELRMAAKRRAGEGLQAQNVYSDIMGTQEFTRQVNYWAQTAAKQRGVNLNSAKMTVSNVPPGVRVGETRLPSSAVPFRPWKNMVIPDGIAVPAHPQQPTHIPLSSDAEGVNLVVGEGSAEIAHRDRRSASQKNNDEILWAKQHHVAQRLGPDNMGVVYSFQRPY